MSDDASGALDRVAREIGGMDVVERLAALSGSDFASVMLEVVRRRAARETPASVLRRYPWSPQAATAKLLASNKERLLISGYGLDRLAMLIESKEIRS